ncbi:hypothetical protein [uncultured Algoriphagus sp.]|uniref:hypothetical protein n=1 Tax=uncultured Algoriphagus sp. TaxID=417365 RepID=UPI0030EE24E7|tara:strand:- start:805 stop:1521 length:717 start_codon:yes stop_codon:yes gene_type:complete
MEAGKYSEYLKIDDRWAIFSTNSMEEHIQKNVIQGVFDKAVPKDIIGDFKIIEYQQVYAYYHWPLMDEALSKGLRLLEMAIKLKAKELSISLKTQDSRPRDKNFNQLINEVCKGEPLIQLKETIHFLRGLRNITTHKESDSYLGGTGGMVKRQLMRLVNLINDLFLNPDELKVKLVSKKAERELFVKNYLESLIISPPATKDLFANEAEWGYEENKYMNKLWLSMTQGLPIISLKIDK